MDPTPNILLVAASQHRHAEMRSALAAVKQTVRLSFFNGPALGDLSGYRVAVVDSGEALSDAASFALRWFRANEEPTRPLIWLADATDQKARAAGWEAGATACLVRPFVPSELQAHVTALLRLEEECRRFHLQAQESNRGNQALLRNYQERDAVCRVAQRIQRSFQPARLPEVQRARFAVIHRSPAEMGGDFYSVERVNEDHVAFYLGDMMGHSLIASLVATLIHRTIARVDARREGLSAPDEILQAVNRDLLRLDLPEQPLGCLTYGVLNGWTGELRYASAAHTGRIYLPRDGEPQSWPDAGPMLGVDDGTYSVQKRTLRPGDRMLLFTDGLLGNGRTVAKTILELCSQHRVQPLAGLLATLTQELLVQTPDPDDFTLLGMEMTDQR
jgi:serine phosphatase RsbU (regulator of sigma subunit)